MNHLVLKFSGFKENYNKSKRPGPAVERCKISLRVNLRVKRSTLGPNGRLADLPTAASPPSPWPVQGTRLPLRTHWVPPSF